MMAALGMLADVSSQLDLETRLQVCRFLGSLIPPIRDGASAVSALVNGTCSHVQELLIALSIIIGSVTSDLGWMAENMMKSERTGWAWAEDEVDKETSIYWGISVLRRRFFEDVWHVREGATGRRSVSCGNRNDRFDNRRQRPSKQVSFAAVQWRARQTEMIVGR